MGVLRRTWERFSGAWIATVGLALGPVVLAGLGQWLGEGHDESAWDRVTASNEYYMIALVVITAALVIWHYGHARRDVFVANRDRGDQALSDLADVTAERDKHASERDAALARVVAAETAKPHIGQYIDKMYQVHLPDDPAQRAAAMGQLGLADARHPVLVTDDAPGDVQAPAAGPQAEASAADNLSDGSGSQVSAP
jgi:hypothetical protein